MTKCQRPCASQAVKILFILDIRDLHAVGFGNR